MNTRPPAPTEPAPRVHAGFWRRRFVQPVVSQLTQGVTPDRIAATLGVGTVCSILPFLGFTTLLNLVVGLALRMNQPLLQGLNQLLTPLQLVLILAYVRAGELLWGHTGDRFTVAEMIRQFRDLSWPEFLQQFGWAGIHAFTAWTLTAPLIALAIMLVTRPLLRRAAARLTP